MRRHWKMVALAAIGLGILGCTGGSAYVGVYGAPVYGPGPWGPYPGRYGPFGPYGGGGVWVGVPVCCVEQEEPQPPQEQPEEAPEAEDRDTGSDAAVSGISEDQLREDAP